MLLPVTLLLWGFLCHFAVPTAADDPPQPRPMILWNAADTEQPTWYLSLEPQAHEGSFWQYVLREARACYIWAKTQPKYLGRDGGESLIVAAFYDAGTGLIELSTVPRAPRRVEMLDWATRGYSPAWYAAAQAYREDATKYCAEDGALFTVECHEGNENAQMRYPDGSFMAVWGRVNSIVGGDKEGYKMNPCDCKRRQRAIPGCQTMLAQLNIKFKPDELPDVKPAAAIVEYSELHYQRPILSPGSMGSHTELKRTLRSCPR